MLQFLGPAQEQRSVPRAHGRLKFPLLDLMLWKSHKNQRGTQYQARLSQTLLAAAKCQLQQCILCSACSFISCCSPVMCRLPSCFIAFLPLHVGMNLSLSWQDCPFADVFSVVRCCQYPEAYIDCPPFCFCFGPLDSRPFLCSFLFFKFLGTKVRHIMIVSLPNQTGLHSNMTDPLGVFARCFFSSSRFDICLGFVSLAFSCSLVLSCLHSSFCVWLFPRLRSPSDCRLDGHIA